jgi:hypothetical protein
VKTSLDLPSVSSSAQRGAARKAVYYRVSSDQSLRSSRSAELSRVRDLSFIPSEINYITQYSLS